MQLGESDSELEAKMGKRFFKLMKTLETYWETCSIEDTARILGLTKATVDRRLSDAIKEFENATKWLKEVDKYKDILFKKETTHSKRISILCKIGKALGHRIWIAMNERSHLCYIDGHEGLLSDLADFWRRPSLLSVDNQPWQVLKFIDVLWIKDQRIHYAFEVETTTSFTKAFDRCSNIPSEHNTVKVIVIPNKRRNRLLTSIQSDLISYEIKKGNWYLLDFNNLKQYNETDGSMNHSAFRNSLESLH